MRAAEASTYENVRANPFMRIHGRPTCGDYEIIKHEAATQASEVEDITYAEHNMVPPRRSGEKEIEGRLFCQMGQQRASHRIWEAARR